MELVDQVNGICLVNTKKRFYVIHMSYEQLETRKILHVDQYDQFCMEISPGGSSLLRGLGVCVARTSDVPYKTWSSLEYIACIYKASDSAASMWGCRGGFGAGYRGGWP